MSRAVSFRTGSKKNNSQTTCFCPNRFILEIIF
ncbi:hypothetical protein FHG68_17205 [Leptospira weilii]|nr:hypothetical protein FHG67_17160 [Leptospira weilii]QDK28810.1 hypothetical protein FHG68_17205 [Leptospira weilii]